MKITGSTRIMFTLGHEIGAMRASDVLNTYFESIGKDVAVSPLDVHPDDLATVLDAIRRMKNVAGFGVTMPHKIAVLRHLDELTDRARDVGAVNFVRRNADGTLLGDNIDGAGFVAGLLRNGIGVKGKRVLQIGAGGAGRATAFALAEAGAAVIFLSNRDPAKAKSLAAELKGIDGAPVGRAGGDMPAVFDLVVNATSLGMKPDDALPFDVALIGPDTAVCDIVVSPPLTKIVEAARQRGAKAIGGRPMLDEQMELVRVLVGI